MTLFFVDFTQILGHKISYSLSIPAEVKFVRVLVQGFGKAVQRNYRVEVGFL